jgi:hypothetical protein
VGPTPFCPNMGDLKGNVARDGLTLRSFVHIVRKGKGARGVELS